MTRRCKLLTARSARPPFCGLLLSLEVKRISSIGPGSARPPMTPHGSCADVSGMPSRTNAIAEMLPDFGSPDNRSGRWASRSREDTPLLSQRHSLRWRYVLHFTAIGVLVTLSFVAFSSQVSSCFWSPYAVPTRHTSLVVSCRTGRLLGRPEWPSVTPLIPEVAA